MTLLGIDALLVIVISFPNGPYTSYNLLNPSAKAETLNDPVGIEAAMIDALDFG